MVCGTEATIHVDQQLVFAPHPIQNRTEDEVRALADDAVDRVVSSITAG